jgi:predicted MFS family arabinose efflux permease
VSADQIEAGPELAYLRLKRAALATALVFAVSGALFGTWVSRLPAVRDHLHASPAQLGLALLAAGIGSLVSMPSVGWLCRRVGSRRAVAVTSVPCAATLVVLALVPSVSALAATLFVFGLFYGSWDVSMNVQGSVVEQRAERAWMPRYHACWSAGGIVGAALGGVAAKAGVPVTVHFGLAAATGAALVLGALPAFVTDRQERAQPAAGTATATATGTAAAAGPGSTLPAPAWRALLTRRLLAIGAITLCSVVAEGAAADWLALYLVDARRTTDWLGAAGYAIFAGAMAAGRFAGTAVTERLGRAGAVRAGGLVCAAGVVLTVTGPGLPLAYVGAAVWALGVCLIFPAAISAAGEVPDRPQDAIAAVSAIGYGGVLVGPPLVGLLAERIGLGRALLALVLLAGAISALAPAVRAARRGPRSAARR